MNRVYVLLLILVDKQLDCFNLAAEILVLLHWYVAKE
jgi:hypothetical protein